jgi:hypothetical protein
METKETKLPQSFPDGHDMYQHLPLKDFTKTKENLPKLGFLVRKWQPWSETWVQSPRHWRLKLQTSINARFATITQARLKATDIKS